MGFGYKGLVFFRNNEHGKGLTVSKWVLINCLKIPQMPQNLSAQIVCPSPKVWNFDEKRLHCVSVVRVSWYVVGTLCSRCLRTTFFDWNQCNHKNWVPSISVPLKPLFWFRSDTETKTQIDRYFRLIPKPKRKNLVTDSMGYFFDHKRAPKSKFAAKYSIV